MQAANGNGEICTAKRKRDSQNGSGMHKMEARCTKWKRDAPKKNVRCEKKKGTQNKQKTGEEVMLNRSGKHQQKLVGKSHSTKWK
jgi:hypothetical protein